MPMRHLVLQAVTAIASTLAAADIACAQPPQPLNPWMKAVSVIVGSAGMLEPDGVLMWNLVRTDVPLSLQIRDARGIGTYTLRPAMAEGMLSFQQLKGDDPVGMPRTAVTLEFALPEQSVDRFADVLRAGGMDVSAIHNHYLQDDPKHVFVHAGGLGNPAKLAAVVRAAWEAVGAKVEAEGKETKDDKVEGIDPGRLAQELGGTPKLLDGVADISVPRLESVMLTLKSETIAIEPELGPESDLDFQPLGGNRAVVVGELCVTAEEAPAVMKSLRQSRIEVDALHNHFLTDQPRLFFMHLQAAGDADDLARAIRQALDLTNSAR